MKIDFPSKASLNAGTWDHAQTKFLKKKYLEFFDFNFLSSGFLLWHGRVLEIIKNKKIGARTQAALGIAQVMVQILA